MRKSHSKIRHIQEANQRLERRVLSEKNWFSRIGDYFRGPESEKYDDESWMELKRQAEDDFDRDVKRGNRPNRYLKSKEEDVMESELVDYISNILNEEIKKDEMSIIRTYYKSKGWKNFQCNSKGICGLSLQCGNAFLTIANSKSPLGGIEVNQVINGFVRSGQEISILEKSKTQIIKDIKNAIMYGLKKYEKDIKNCTNIESKL